jgi:tRNA A37 threonylcarbamoyladenosine dehydratase
MAQRLREIVPCCHVEARTAIFTVEAAAELLEGASDKLAYLGPFCHG